MIDNMGDAWAEWGSDICKCTHPNAAHDDAERCRFIGCLCQEIRND